MASTELRRKAQRNRTRAKDKVQTIKRLGFTPVIKKVDVEELKAQFSTKAAPKKATPKAKKEAEVKEVEAQAEVVETQVEETPEVKEEAPAAATEETEDSAKAE
jgi:Zn-finger domain-containing protein